jgi:hypothetical protein
VIEEKAMGLLLAKIPTMAQQRALEILQDGLRTYAEAALTTAQEGAILPAFLNLLEASDKAGMLPIDIVCDPVYVTTDDDLMQRIADTWRAPVPRPCVRISSPSRPTRGWYPHSSRIM